MTSDFKLLFINFYLNFQKKLYYFDRNLLLSFILCCKVKKLHRYNQLADKGHKCDQNWNFIKEFSNKFGFILTNKHASV